MRRATPRYSLEWAIRGWRALRLQRGGCRPTVILNRELRIAPPRGGPWPIADCLPLFDGPPAARAG